MPQIHDEEGYVPVVGERFIYTVLARDARRWYSSGLNEQVPHGFHVCAGK
jgi:hypothetical protein